ncbi:unnamed protein product [Amoebophrya sp. A120]|nr:unnamed protein product [Amoebophrya sp. A120]|eukprot:GSA120T00006913001.1
MRRKIGSLSSFFGRPPGHNMLMPSRGRRKPLANACAATQILFLAHLLYFIFSAPVTSSTTAADPHIIQPIFDTKFDCDPIVSPEMPTRREQGFAHLSFKFADEVEKLYNTKKPSKWLFETISFVAADVETVLENNHQCKAAGITALVMKALLELLQSGLLQGKLPQDETAILVLDAMLSNELIQWVPNSVQGPSDGKKLARVPEGTSHLLLGSSFPVFRLLHMLMLLYPETGSTRMGHCKQHHDESIPMHKRVDWDLFYKQLVNATDASSSGSAASGRVEQTESGTKRKKTKQISTAAHDSQRNLQANTIVQIPSNGDATYQKITVTAANYKKWEDLYHLEKMMSVADSADMIFQSWRTDQYKAGCHLAVIAAYVLHAFWYARSDRQAWFQRFLTAVTSVHAVHAPIADAIKADNWPVYSLWDMLYRMRRERLDFPSRGDGSLVARIDYTEERVSRTSSERGPAAPEAAEATAREAGDTVIVPGNDPEEAENQRHDQSTGIVSPEFITTSFRTRTRNEPSLVDRRHLLRLVKNRMIDTVQEKVEDASTSTATASGSRKTTPSKSKHKNSVVFFTQAYGWMATHVRKVVRRFREKFGLNLIVLMDTTRTPAASASSPADSEQVGTSADHDESEPEPQCTKEELETWCLPTFPSLIAKYDALIHLVTTTNAQELVSQPSATSASRSSSSGASRTLSPPPPPTGACWVDLDIAWLQSPANLFDEKFDFVLASKDQYGIGVSPAVLCVPIGGGPGTSTSRIKTSSTTKGSAKTTPTKAGFFPQVGPHGPAAGILSEDAFTAVVPAPRQAAVGGSGQDDADHDEAETTNMKASASSTASVDSDGLVVSDSLITGHHAAKSKIQNSQSSPSTPKTNLVLDILYQIRHTLLLNPFGFDLQMWDLILGRQGADDVGGWDYQGRSHQANPDNRTISYWDETRIALPVRGVRYKVLESCVLASGDGFSMECGGQSGGSCSSFSSTSDSGASSRSNVTPLLPWNAPPRLTKELEKEEGAENIHEQWIQDVKDYAEARVVKINDVDPPATTSSGSTTASIRRAKMQHRKDFLQLSEEQLKEIYPFPPREMVGFHFHAATESADELFQRFYHDDDGEMINTKGAEVQEKVKVLSTAGESILKKYAKYRKFDQLAVANGVVVLDAAIRKNDVIQNYEFLEKVEEDIILGAARRSSGEGREAASSADGSTSRDVGTSASSDEDDDSTDVDHLLQQEIEKSKVSIGSGADVLLEGEDRSAAMRKKRRRRRKNANVSASTSDLSEVVSQETTINVPKLLAKEHFYRSTTNTISSQQHEIQATNWVHISYADGCCQKAIKKNLETGKGYFQDQRAYDSTAFDPVWKEQHNDILSVKTGGGLWIWKPYVMLKTLEDENVPWDSVVVYLDAGNHFTNDPRLFVLNALKETDVAVLQLKCCFEADWSKRETLMALNGDHHAISERPQMGAYFLAFRKTPLALRFARHWLSKMIDPVIVKVESIDKSVKNYAGFQKHMADQSALSVLFKQYGFKHVALKDVHKFIALKRWRE